MATNIQFRFYKNDEGDILVRALIDETDMNLPIERAYGSFYHWPEFRLFLLSRLDTAMKILE